MTSNLAKFVSGHSNSPAPTSPISAQSPRSPQSPISRSTPSPSKPEDEPGQLLTIEQFKWSIGCCCHEIKSKDPSSSPSRQYHTYEISVSSAGRPPMESQRFSWTPSVHSLASQINSPTESLNRSSSHHLSSIASSTGSNQYPGCEAILGPMAVQDLVRLLSFLLSIAPEQWIPWHLYDFFVRPQGRAYRDLVELLPTQSQRVLRTILATVDLLVDFAVASEQQEISPAHCSTSVSSAGKVPGAHLRTKSDVYEVSKDAMAGSEGPSFGSMAMRAFEQSLVSSTDPGKRNTFRGEIPTTTSASAGSRDEIWSQRIQAIRVLKRKAIIDKLSSLVFRSRQDVAVQLYGSSSSPSRDSTSFNLRRSSMPASPRATTLAPAQGSEQERASALLAFENLVSAYEDEHYPQRSRTSMTTHPAQSTASGGSEESQSGDHEFKMSGPGLRLLGRSLTSTHRSGSGSTTGSRHARTPTSLFSPILESDGIGGSRSLSLPPWRKQPPLISVTTTTAATTTESRRPKLATSVSSPSPSSGGVQREIMVESRSLSALGRLDEDMSTQQASVMQPQPHTQPQQQPQPIQLAPLRLLILEEEEILIKDTSDEESWSEGEDEDELDIDAPLGQRSSLAALDGSENAGRDADKARDEDLRDLLAQGLSLLKYKRKRRLKKKSSTFGDLVVYDRGREGGGGGGGPSTGPSRLQGAEQDPDDDADVSGNEV
ncbi:hypothetical protein BGZ81_008478 [Podila clonocystis]|nr:hypothetical protein BGZ81_008478 [Podila clonocystis]